MPEMRKRKGKKELKRREEKKKLPQISHGKLSSNKLFFFFCERERNIKISEQKEIIFHRHRIGKKKVSDFIHKQTFFSF